MLIIIEIYGLHQFTKTQKYFTDDELDEEQFSYQEHVHSDRNDQIDQLMDAANIEGVEFKTGKVRYSEQLNHEQIENKLLLGDIQKQ